MADGSPWLWLEYLRTVDWATWGKTFVSAGLGSAAVAAGFTLYRERRQAKAKAGYMAMRLAVILESYVLSCAEFYYQNNYREPDPDPGRDTNWDYTLPELATYPEDAEGWQAIKRDLASQSLGFRNQVQTDQWSLNWTSQLSPEELEHQIILTVTRLGLEAWDIAESLRREHDVRGGTAKAAVTSLKITQERELRRFEEAKAKSAAERAASGLDLT
jgi:hypothetical protein